MRGGIVAVLVIGGLSIAALPPAAAAEIKPYEKVTGEVSGSLKCVGSDTMNNLVAHWAEGFKKFYPSVQEGIEGKGSASGPPALTEGTSTFGPMSRDWKPSEIDTFKEKHGYAPTVLPTAIDMLAVFVHKDNPLKGLSLQQVDAIFSKNRNGGAKDDVRTWGDLGLEGEWKDKPISLYGRNASSGQGTARQFGRRAGRGERQVWHRLQRHRLCDRRRAGRAAGTEDGGGHDPPRVEVCLQRRVSARSTAVHERQLQAGLGARSIAS